MLKTSVFRLQAVCPGCNNYHAVSSIADTGTCQNCGREINISEIIYGKMFGIIDRQKYMNGFLAGSIEQTGGSGAYRLEYTSMPAKCEECGNVIETEALLSAIDNMVPAECPACRHKMPARKADSKVRKFHPAALGVINDSQGADAGSVNTGNNGMLVFKCMTCGAGLELTAETKRSIKCSYCDNENYLPDEIWTKLHPHKEVPPMIFLLDINEEDINETTDYFLRVTALGIYSKHFENFIREYFESPFITDPLLVWFKKLVSSKNSDSVSFNMDISRVQKYYYDSLKLSISTHPAELKAVTAEYSVNLPEELQMLLADDKDEKVRLALVKNPNLEKHIIKKLKSDMNGEVSAGAGKRRTGLLSRLFG